MTDPVVEAFVCRDKTDYATFLVYQRPHASVLGDGYFVLAIESSYGNGFAYAWSCLGCSFYDFLIRQQKDPYYVAMKMTQGEGKQPDWEETARAIRKYICEQRLQGEYTREEARAAWPDIFESETEFSSWNDNQDLVDCAYEFIESRSGRRYQDFVALHKAFWPQFCEQLEAAKAKRESVGEAVST